MSTRIQADLKNGYIIIVITLYKKKQDPYNSCFNQYFHIDRILLKSCKLLYGWVKNQIVSARHGDRLPAAY